MGSDEEFSFSKLDADAHSGSGQHRFRDRTRRLAHLPYLRTGAIPARKVRGEWVASAQLKAFLVGDFR